MEISEENIEKGIIVFIQNIVNGYAQRKIEYLKYISADTVDVGKLLLALNKARLLQKLYSSSKDIVERYDIEQTPEKCTLSTKGDLTNALNELISNVNDMLRKIKKDSIESFDTDDDEEYYQVQRKIREKKKKYNQYRDFLSSLLNIVAYHVDISIQQQSSIDPASTITTNEAIDNSPLAEQTFFNWLVSEGDASNASQYISNIHIIEKLYQTIFGVRKDILGAASTDDIKLMIEELVRRNEYIDANYQRYNNFDIALSKFVQFADIPVEGLKITPEKENHQLPTSTQSYAIKTVDFEKHHNYTYYKPHSFILNGSEYYAGSWRDLYKKFIILLYTDNAHSKIIKTIEELNGKPLYGKEDLSAVNIMKRIRCLMQLCSIDDKHMTIKYSALSDDSSNHEEMESENDKQQESPSFDSPSLELSVTDDERIADNTSTPASFAPDTAKPFVLKNAVIEMLLSDAPEITKYREYKNGISSENLCKLIEEYYGKVIFQFEMSKLLMRNNRTFQSVGKGYYILKEASSDKDKFVETATKPVHTVDATVAQEDKKTDYTAKQIAVTVLEEPQEIGTDARHIILRLNGNVTETYDYSDALNKICEFAINYKPFKMARIAGEAIQLRGNNVFYRKVVPVNGYNKLSNGLQVIAIATYSDLQTITTAVEKYCQIDDGMITIINQ